MANLDVHHAESDFDRAIAAFESWVRSLPTEEVPHYELAERRKAMGGYVLAIISKFEANPEKYFDLLGVRTNCRVWPEQVPYLLQLVLHHAEQVQKRASDRDAWNNRVHALTNALERFGVAPLPQKRNPGTEEGAQQTLPPRPRSRSLWSMFQQERILSGSSTDRGISQAMSDGPPTAIQVVRMRRTLNLQAGIEREEFRAIVAMSPDPAAEKFREFLLYAIHVRPLHREIVDLVSTWVSELLKEDPKSAAWTRARAWAHSCIYRHRVPILSSRQRAEIAFGHLLEEHLKPLQPAQSKARVANLKKKRKDREAKK